MFCILDILSDESGSPFKNSDVKAMKTVWNTERGCQVWILPGHIMYCSSDRKKLMTCDVNGTVKECEPHPVCISTSEILHVHMNVEDSPILFVAHRNGDITVYGFSLASYEWISFGQFTLDASSSKNSNECFFLHSVYFHPTQKTIFWIEERENGCKETAFSLCRGSYPTIGSGEITQNSIQQIHVMLYNCPKMKIVILENTLCIWFQLPNTVQFYLLWMYSSHLSLFDVNGKCLWRRPRVEYPVDFLTLMMTNIGLLTTSSPVIIAEQISDNNAEKMCVLQENKLSVFNSNGEICHKIILKNFCNGSVHTCYIFNYLLFIFSDASLDIYNVNTGDFIQMIHLSQYGELRGICYQKFFVPLLGFYTDCSVYQVHYKSLKDLLYSDIFCYSSIATTSHEHLQLMSLLKMLLSGNITEKDKLPLSKLPTSLQSNSLMIALVQLCREKGIASYNFPFEYKDIRKLLNFRSELENYPETKLSRMLQPLVECYCAFEEGKQKVLGDELPENVESQL